MLHRVVRIARRQHQHPAHVTAAKKNEAEVGRTFRVPPFPPRLLDRLHHRRIAVAAGLDGSAIDHLPLNAPENEVARRTILEVDVTSAAAHAKDSEHEHARRPYSSLDARLLYELDSNYTGNESRVWRQKPREARKMNLSHRPGTAIIFCIVLADATHAQDDWSNTRDSFICRSSTEVREIKTYVSENTLSCRVDYIKKGTTQTIWSSRTGRSYCDGKASNLAARLGAGNFSCKPLHLQGSEKD